MIGQVIGSVVPMVRLPLTLLEAIESLVTQVQHEVTRTAAVVDQVEPTPARVDALVGQAEDVTARLGAVVGQAEQLLASVDPAVLQALLLEGSQLLPRLATLEELVPVVAKLGEQVDSLNRSVGEVAALLGGIPGAARLVKRGAGPARS